MKKQFFLITIFFFLAIEKAEAKLFEVQATRTSTGQTISAGFDSVQEALDYFKGKNLNSIFGTNVDNEPMSVLLNYRGLNASLTYATDQTLTLNIDGIVNNKTFRGVDRDDSVKQLKDFLKHDGGAVLDQVNKRMVAVSPADPIAGNPTSLMWQMVDHDFDLSFSDSLYDTRESDENGKKIGNEMGAGVKYANFNAAGIRSNLVSVSPFSWRRNLFDSDVKLLLKIPVLTMITTEGSKSYQANSSIGLQIPLYKEFWSITPMASIGAVVSVDQASASALHGFSATNKFHIDVNNWGMSLGTMLGRYSTQKISYRNYTSNPDIANTVLKNTFAVNTPPIIASKFATEFSVSNTKYYGTELYIQNGMEYGLALVKTNNRLKNNNEFRTDLKYFDYYTNHIATIGNGSRRIQGVMVNLKFQY